MSEYRAEFMVEPFVEGSLGPPVLAAIDAVTTRGFEPQVGAFGTTINGDANDVIEALSEMLNAAMEAGASRVTVQVDRDHAS
ncbi:MAG: thiamine-binding protein [Actinomycetia bacterium]|nr:thiamine-binding protein [Actinomycetes bacterium]